MEQQVHVICCFFHDYTGFFVTVHGLPHGRRRINSNGVGSMMGEMCQLPHT